MERYLSGGKGLEKALAKLSASVHRRQELKVGFLEGGKGSSHASATYPDRNHTPVAYVAAIQEFGAPRAKLGRIPPRPFFRTMIRKHSKDWPGTLGNLLKKDGFDSEKALPVLGESMVDQLRDSIIDLDSPPLSEVTLLLRERYWMKDYGKREVIQAIHDVKAGTRANVSGTQAKPLVVTGQMLRRVGWEVT